MNMLQGYFDYAAATPMDERVKSVMEPYFNEKFYNPSALYQPAREVANDLKHARQTASILIGSKPTEIIFTAGGSEANNLAINGVMSKLEGANMIISAIEHESVVAPAEKFDLKVCEVDAKGFINLQKLKKLIDDKTVLVSIMIANNEIGTIQPLRKIAEILDDVRSNRQEAGNELPIYLHSDCAQGTNYLDLHVSRLGVDLMTINGGKIYGPKQSGLLFVRTGVLLAPLILGGGQERGLRSGTENLANIVGFVKALELATKYRNKLTKEHLALQRLLINGLKDLDTEVQFNGSLKNRLPNNLNVTFFGKDNERIMMKLDELGFQVAVGSACSASSDEPSHVLKAIGLSESDIRSSLRFSIGRFSDEASVDALLKALKTSVHA